MEEKVYQFGFASVKFTMSLKLASGNIKSVASVEIYFQSIMLLNPWIWIHILYGESID